MIDDDMELMYGSGNVFRDVGLPNPDLWLARARVAARIVGVLDDRKLSVRKAAAKTKFAAADFSRVRNADLGRFTLDRLIRMLNALDPSISLALVFGDEDAA